MSAAANGGGNGQAPAQQQPATPPANGQAPTSGQANNGSAPLGGAPNGQAPTATNDSYAPPSADEWKRVRQELEEARRDAGKYRDELKKRDDANLTAQQKLERDYSDMQAKVYEYEARLQQQSLQIAGYRLGSSLGIGDIGAALALVQAEHAHEVKFAADGTPENISDLLKAVLKDHPVLATTPGKSQQTSPTASGGPTNPGRQAGNGGLTLEMIRAMPMRERIARMDEIKAWEKAQRQQQS